MLAGMHGTIGPGGYTMHYTAPERVAILHEEAQRLGVTIGIRTEAAFAIATYLAQQAGELSEQDLRVSASTFLQDGGELP